jgi:uncharacterized protein YndB with AHSA1/START domain
MSTPAPAHIYQTYIRASAAQVWEAITDPEFTKRYFHRTAFESTLQPGSPYRMVLPDGSDAVVGTIEEVDPNRRLVMTWRILYDADAAEEPPSRVEWLLAEGSDGVTKVTTVHRDLAASPATSASVADGWYWVLQSMKSLLETGEALPGSAPGSDEDRQRAATSLEQADAELHRRQGITANNSTWELLDGRQLAADEIDDVLGRAYAAMYHWRRAARRQLENAARGSWLVSRVHATLGHGELALHHADQTRKVVEEAGLGDFDLAYAHEARARALACLGRLGEAAVELKAAQAVPIADAEDKKILDADLASEPWYSLTL